jgi:hypothetical protein
MSDNRIVAGLIDERDLCKLREAVCICTEKVYDSCKDKDCIEDAEVVFKNPNRVQRLINRALDVKAKNAEVVKVITDVEPVPFKRGFYTVHVKFFIKLLFEFFVPSNTGQHCVVPIPGLVIFSKKVILFGSEGGVKIFKSYFEEDCEGLHVKSVLEQDNLPISKVEVAEPIALNARIAEVLDIDHHHHKCDRMSIEDIPESIANHIKCDDMNDAVLVEESEDRCKVRKEVLATVGLFSIIKLVRISQLLIPAFDFCVPNKKCIASTDENPCEIFDNIEFPIDEFFPPQRADFIREE